MTTKNFSAIKLPQPRYSCQIGCCDVTSSTNTTTYTNGSQIEGNHSSNLAKWLPPFTDLIQMIEVRQTGCTAESVLKPMTNLVDTLLKSTSGSGIIIENARPELFLRRDFISSFVDHGFVHMWPMWSSDNGGGQAEHQYDISCRQNVLTILLNEKQYRRFGLVAKKVTGAGGSPGSRRHSKRHAAGRHYRIDIDLKENQIKESNKYQERLITTLRRLSPVNKLYLRFAPSSRSEPAIITEGPDGIPSGAEDGAAISFSRQQETADKCIEFFRFVMREYAEDGLKPVPLTGCSRMNLKLERNWTNYSQRCPKFEGLPLRELQKAGASIRSSSDLTTMPPVHRNVELLNEVLDLVNWLGYQVLSLDTAEELQSSFSGVYDGDEGGDRGQVLDVSCSQLSGLVDCERLGSGLEAMLAGQHSLSGHQDYIKLRALILYECSPVAPSSSLPLLVDAVEAGYGGSSNAGVVLLQDCSSDATNLITALKMSSLPT